MSKTIKRYSRLTLVLITTLVSILFALLIVFIGYKLMDDKIRKTTIIMAVVAPLVIASTICWYLYGLIKKLEELESELRQRITKDKEDVYFATIRGAQHVINNLLNGLILVDMEIEKHPSFNKETSVFFHEMLYESKKLMDKLSSVELITPESIKKSVEPTQRHHLSPRT